MASSPMITPNAIEEETPTVVNSNFEILTGSQTPSKILIKNGFAFININVKCKTTCTGSQIICTVPKPAKVDTISGLAWNDYGANVMSAGLIQVLGNVYNLYINGANRNTNYGLSICYPIE